MEGNTNPVSCTPTAAAPPSGGEPLQPLLLVDDNRGMKPAVAPAIMHGRVRHHWCPGCGWWSFKDVSAGTDHPPLELPCPDCEGM